MSEKAYQIIGVSIVYLIVCSGVDHRKHQSFASLAFVRGVHRWPVNSPHKGPVTRKIFPCDDVIMFPEDHYQHPWYWLCMMIAFFGSEFQQPVTFQCRGMMRNTKIILCYVFSKCFSGKCVPYKRPSFLDRSGVIYIDQSPYELLEIGLARWWMFSLNYKRQFLVTYKSFS